MNKSSTCLCNLLLIEYNQQYDQFSASTHHQGWERTAQNLYTTNNENGKFEASADAAAYNNAADVSAYNNATEDKASSLDLTTGPANSNNTVTDFSKVQHFFAFIKCFQIKSGMALDFHKII